MRTVLIGSAWLAWSLIVQGGMAQEATPVTPDHAMANLEHDSPTPLSQADFVVRLDRFTPDQKRMEVVLERRFSLDIEPCSLGELMDRISSATGVGIRFDAKALDDAGIDPKKISAGSCRFSDVRLRSLLQSILREYELSLQVDDGFLTITTKEKADMTLHAWGFVMRHFIRQTDGKYDAEQLEMLRHTLQWTCAPQSWDEVGGPGTIDYLPLRGEMLLVVSQTEEVLEHVASILSTLRRHVAEEEAARGTAAAPSQVKARSARSSKSLLSRSPDKSARSSGGERHYLPAPHWAAPRLHP